MRLNQEEIEYLNSIITNREIESVMQTFQHIKIQDQMALHWLILSNTHGGSSTNTTQALPETKKEGTRPIQSLKPDKGVAGKENCRPVTLVNTDLKGFSKMLANPSSDM